MAINNNLGFKETVQVLGLKRRFFGFESDKSLARRAFKEMGMINPCIPFMAKIFNPPPRVCIREERFEILGEYQNPVERGVLGHGWRFYYNDDTTEVVTVWDRK